MKILSSKRRYNSDDDIFKRITGEPLWIMVEYHGRDYYMQIVNDAPSRGEPWYCVRFFTTDWLESLQKGVRWNRSTIDEVAEKYFWKRSDISTGNSIEFLSDADIFGDQLPAFDRAKYRGS